MLWLNLLLFKLFVIWLMDLSILVFIVVQVTSQRSPRSVWHGHRYPCYRCQCPEWSSVIPPCLAHRQSGSNSPPWLTINCDYMAALYMSVKYIRMNRPNCSVWTRVVAMSQWIPANVTVVDGRGLRAVWKFHWFDLLMLQEVIDNNCE